MSQVDKVWLVLGRHPEQLDSVKKLRKEKHIIQFSPSLKWGHSFCSREGVENCMGLRTPHGKQWHVCVVYAHVSGRLMPWFRSLGRDKKITSSSLAVLVGNRAHEESHTSCSPEKLAIWHGSTCTMVAAACKKELRRMARFLWQAPSLASWGPASCDNWPSLF